MEKQKISKCLLISFVLGAAYLIYSAVYWSGAVDTTGSEQVGAALAATIVFPHLACTAVAVLLNGLGTFMRSRGLALAGAILYAVAMVLFPMYFFFVIVQMILSFVGFALMKKSQ